jgi:putative flippase GtrA
MPIPLNSKDAPLCPPSIIGYPPPVQSIDPAASLSSRLISRRLAKLLSQNTAVSCGTFLLGLALLWLLVQLLHVDKYPATAISFLLATSLHYVVARLWIFRGSQRAAAAGYFYFFVNAGVGLGATMVFFALFNEMLGMNYLVARVVASVFAGLAAFLLNATLNFRSL